MNFCGKDIKAKHVLNNSIKSFSRYKSCFFGWRAMHQMLILTSSEENSFLELPFLTCDETLNKY